MPLILILLFANNIYANEPTQLPVKDQIISKSNLIDFSDIIPDLLPTVVNISTSKKVGNDSAINIEELLKSLPKDSALDELKNLLEKKKYPQEESYSSGSGFIISQDGYIVTNNHVIDGADDISVSLKDGKKISAKLIGSDERTDLALLKIDVKEKLPFTKFGDSGNSKIGQWVIAVGNPFGLGGSVSTGIISAHGRDINEGQINDFIQTDAAINKGNSGGPLFNINGEVIGIATAIYSPSGGNVGIGFATPSNIAKDIIFTLKKNGKIKRGYLGVSVQEVSKEIADAINLNDISGAVVIKVFKDSPAYDGDILSGDIITKFNGQKITKMKELPMIVGQTEIGKKVKIEVIRNGKNKILKVKLAQLGKKEKKDNKEESKINILGMGLVEINDRIRKKHKIDDDVRGLLIDDINDNSIAKSKGVLKGDIILSANQILLKSVKKFNKVIAKSKDNKKESIFLIVKRGDDNFAIILPIN
ncbi:Do family serine endopeptidase [Rickettsiales bacterium]|nr:Do family serine endopeptidase [Rickettsiales bacterium]MDB2550660.1 Do family serine endopeptidase [Rickettsiales bacterium]